MEEIHRHSPISELVVGIVLETRYMMRVMDTKLLSASAMAGSAKLNIEPLLKTVNTLNRSMTKMMPGYLTIGRIREINRLVNKYNSMKDDLDKLAKETVWSKNPFAEDDED